MFPYKNVVNVQVQLLEVGQIDIRPSSLLHFYQLLSVYKTLSLYLGLILKGVFSLNITNKC